MAEITMKRRGELIRKVFEILTANADGLQAKDVMKKAEETLILTAFEKSTYPKRPDVRRFEKIVRFASIPHVKAGWLVKEKWRWVLTEEGVQAFKKFTEPEEFEREAVRLYREWEATREPTQPTMAVIEEEESAPDPGTILEEAEELAWSGVEQHIQEMNPYDLQQLVAALLRAMDYHVSWVSPPGLNLLFSVLLFDPQRRLKPHLLTLASGLALVQAVQQVTGLQPKLKWPNDLLIDAQKAAGILVEVCSDSQDTPARTPSSRKSDGCGRRKNTMPCDTHFM